MKVHLVGIGEVNEDSDLWSLFEDDAEGRTGLFSGQLFHELYQQAPAWLPKLVQIIRRALVSNNSADRIAALHGALQLPSTSLGPELELLSRLHADWLAHTQSPAGTTVLSLFFELLAREPQGSAPAIQALENAHHLTGTPTPARARALVRLNPERATRELLLALDSQQEDNSADLLKELSFSSSFDDLTKVVAARPEELRRRFVTIAYRALGADHFAAAWDRWSALATLLGAMPEQSPPRPPESDVSVRLAELLKKID
jgi:hypothetical protein